MEMNGRDRVSTKRRRLILIPCPYQGHINPMLQLATYLHKNGGFSITIAYTFFNSLDPSLHPDFDFFRYQDGVSKDDASSKSPGSILLSMNVNCSCRASLEEQIMAAVERGRREEEYGEVVCIVYDEVLHFCEALANCCRIRSIVFRTTSAATCLSRMVTLQLLTEDLIHSPGSNLEDDVPNLQPLRFKDLPIPSNKSDHSVFKWMIPQMYSTTTTSAIIWNTMDWLEQSEFTKIKSQLYKIPIFPIGPIHRIASTSPSNSLLIEDSKCLSWLDQHPQNSVIYISLGSVVALSVDELEEMAWGLANSHQPFLWVIRPGLVRGSNKSSSSDDRLPEWFKEKVGVRGCVVKWAPQKEVLAHRAVGVFWSHCGWNSTLESLSEGVPMLCSSCTGDQRVNGRYVSYLWRVGIGLEDGLNRNEIEKAIRRLMVEEEGGEIRQRAIQFKNKLEASVTNNGSSSLNLEHLVNFINHF